MTATTKQTTRKKAHRSRTDRDWDRDYVESFLEKYCRDAPPAPAPVEDLEGGERSHAGPTTERERIIAEELDAKLERPETAAPLAVAPARPAAGTAVLTLAYVAVFLALATSGFVLLAR